MLLDWVCERVENCGDDACEGRKYVVPAYIAKYMRENKYSETHKCGRCGLPIVGVATIVTGNEN